MNQRSHKTPKKKITKTPIKKIIEETTQQPTHQQQTDPKNISVKNITIGVPGRTLIENSDVIISYGHKYGLIGHNGSGKTTLLRFLVERRIPLPKDIDIYYVEQEANIDDKSIFETVISANRKRLKLLTKLEELKNILDGETHSNKNTLKEYNSINDRLNQIDAYKDESIVSKILIGLGFDQSDHSKPASFFSGGWRMRISLARALYMQPRLLLLDEPTNHLDLNSVIWLTRYLSNSWKKSLVIVSHDRNFLDEVCTDIVHLENKRLTYYKGNYSKYLGGYELHLKTRENEWKKIERKVIEMRKKMVPKDEVQSFISSNEHLKPIQPYRVKLSFGQIPIINNPLIDITNMDFGFSDLIVYQNLNFRINNTDRMAIVGNNGIGKSTFFKLLNGDLIPTNGFINRDRKLKIGYYHQHSSDILPLNLTPVGYLQLINPQLSDHESRRHLGRTGLDGSLHFNQILTLSGGQKSRLVFASLFIMAPQLLLLDEPTNHLDMTTIDALIESINNYNGAVLLISHNIHLIEKTACSIYEVTNYGLVKTDFEDYITNF